MIGTRRSRRLIVLVAILTGGLFAAMAPDDTYAQMEESLRIIANCWRQDEFEWHGLLDIAPHPILQAHRPLSGP